MPEIQNESDDLYEVYEDNGFKFIVMIFNTFS